MVFYEASLFLELSQKFRINENILSKLAIWTVHLANSSHHVHVCIIQWIGWPLKLVDIVCAIWSVYMFYSHISQFIKVVLEPTFSCPFIICWKSHIHCVAGKRIYITKCRWKCFGALDKRKVVTEKNSHL